MGFWVRKSKLNRREFLMPDIARITPYPLEQCLERLEQYTGKQKLYHHVELSTSQDEYDSDVWYFTLWKNFIDSQPQSGMRGSATLQITGTLMRWKAGQFTRVRAVVKTSPSFYIVGTMFILICAVILAILSSLPAAIYLIFNLCIIAFAAFFIYQYVASTRSAKRVFLDEIKEVLHKPDGSIE